MHQSLARFSEPVSSVHAPSLADFITTTPVFKFSVHTGNERESFALRLADAKSDGAPLWDGKAELRARIALPDERALFADAKNNGQPSEGLMLVYLIELDGGETDEQSVDPGAFPPGRLI